MFVKYDKDMDMMPIKIWLPSEDNIEDNCMEQALHLARLPFVHKWIALMPDTHAGKGMPIGGVIACEGAVIPNAVGVDIGCGIPSLIPIDSISVSRIAHPSDRFSVGQYIRAIVRSRDGSRICLSHKELLGTWEENASGFKTGETVSGIVRSVENYGVFVELSPNLAGLAELRDDIQAGQNVSVYIKAIIPEKMKIKLVIVDVCDDCSLDKSYKYFTDSSHFDRWDYAPECSGKKIYTEFQTA